ncbi:MAG: dihydropteroate synthase [Phycisphaerales bacterium]
MGLLLHDKTEMSLDRPRIMGILNLTPDSFSDGGQYTHTEQAVRHGLEMAEQGADIIDAGGESTRPGAKRISTDEQIRRVVPVIRALRRRLDERYPAVPISIDTTRADVALAAVEAGATVLNDISAGREDPRMLGLAAERGLPIVLMHMQGDPGTMQDRPHYTDVVEEVRDFLLERAEAALSAGVDRRRIVLDPGIGFGKTAEHNLALLRSVGEFVKTGYPVLIGASRKRFLAGFAGPGGAPDADGQVSLNKKINDRLGGTCAVTAYGVLAGVKVFRVHDVAPNRQAAGLALALGSPENRPGE